MPSRSLHRPGGPLEEVALSDPGDAPRPRRRRRAVGPRGARPAEEPVLDLGDERPALPEDDERLLREVPPHHG